MTPEDLAATLSDHLRREGVPFNPVEVEAFAAGARFPPGTDRDINALARRFRESREAAAKELKWRYVQAWLSGLCVTAIGVAALLGGALFSVYRLTKGSAADYVAQAIAPVALISQSLFGVVLAFCGIYSAIHTSHRLRAESRQHDPVMPSQNVSRTIRNPPGSGL